MRLKTIWTSGYPLAEKLHRTSEWWWYYTAPRFVPRRLRYGVLIHEGVRAIRHDEEVPAVPFTDVLQRSGAKLRR